MAQDERDCFNVASAGSLETAGIMVISGEDHHCLYGRTGENLYQLLASHGIAVDNACGGHQTCGKCKVKIEREAPEASAEEIEALTTKELEEGVRLACGVQVREGMKVLLESRKSRGKVLGLKGFLNASARARVTSLVFDWHPGTLDDQRDVMTRVQAAWPEVSLKFSLSALREIAALTTGDTKKSARFIIYDRTELLGITTEPYCYGIALDIGTTTIAATLVNLTDGLTLNTVTGMNPQRTYGGDVISRIHYTMHEHKGLERLQRCVADEINNMIFRICQQADINRSSIYEMTVSGNTTMLHLLLGIPCESIAVSPFIPGFTDAVRVKAREVGLNIHPEGYVVTLPAVSAYIGGDTVGAIQATRLFESEKYCLLVDIGTNGEIVLGNCDWMIACSAAAGPAFEGASIRHGIGGIEGAIDHVNFETDGIYTTIGKKRPLGICGSGILDVMAELKRVGLLERTGRLLGPDELQDLGIRPALTERVLRIEGATAFMLDFDHEIYLSQRDVREVQLAKSAIRSGIEILIRHAGIRYEAIDQVFIAGGFGNFMSIESAAAIGLIPEVLKEKCVPADNAALKGAAMMLMDEDAAGMKGIHKKIQCLEMSCDPRFQALFVEFMAL